MKHPELPISRPASPMLHRLVILPTIYVATAATLVVAFAPLCLWAAALGLALAARRHLARWPQYSRPDPSLVSGDVPFAWLEWGLPVLTLAIGLSVSYWILSRFEKRSWLTAVPTILALAWLLGIGLLRLDPGNIVNWYID